MGPSEFHELVREHRHRIYGFACYSLRHPEDAEDVTQEVLIRLWKHRRRLDRARVGAWLMRVTRNACCDVVRRRGTAGRHFVATDAERIEAMASDAPSPEADAEAAAFRGRLEAALRRLREPYRSAIVLREIQGLKYAEISEILERPLNTIKVYIHRGRKMLREEMHEESRHAKAC